MNVHMLFIVANDHGKRCISIKLFTSNYIQKIISQTYVIPEDIE